MTRGRTGIGSVLADYRKTHLWIRVEGDARSCRRTHFSIRAFERDARRIRFAEFSSGQALLEFAQRGRTKTATLTLAENPFWEVVLYEDAGMTVTPEKQAFREDWLGSKAR